MRGLWLIALIAILGACDEEPQRLTYPEPLTVESPFRYPPALWDSGTEGETLLMVRVTEAGAVDSAYVLKPSGHAAFDSAAVSGADELRFTPGRRGEERIAAWVRVPVRFRQTAARDSTGGAP